MYYGIVTRVVKIQEISGADNIALAVFPGYSVVVSKTTQVGDIGILFPPDGQLSPEFLSANNLYRDSARNKDTTIVGYFSDNGRVTALKLMRGRVISEGFWCPLSYLSFIPNPGSLEVGYQFNDINGVHICNKYETPATIGKRAGNKNNGNSRGSLLPKHRDTENLKYSLDEIERLLDGEDPEKVRIIITEKIHGTSGRTGKIVHLPADDRFIFRMLRRFHLIQSLPLRREVVILNGTRNTIVEDRKFQKGDADLYRNDILKETYPFLFEGEAIFYEIAGFDSHGKPIMQVRGNDHPYTYGTNIANARRVFVYNIREQRQDDSWRNLSWHEIEARCRNLNLETVPVLDDCSLATLCGELGSYSSVSAMLMDWCDRRANVPTSSSLDERHIMEGVCLRIEIPGKTPSVYKHKAKPFLISEGITKADDAYVDTEESN